MKIFILNSVTIIVDNVIIPFHPYSTFNMFLFVLIFSYRFFQIGIDLPRYYGSNDENKLYNGIAFDDKKFKSLKGKKKSL